MTKTNNSIPEITTSDFLDYVKVLKMLYGRDVAVVFFERNFEEFSGFSINDLTALKKQAKLKSPQGKIQNEE